jgi:nitrate reductase alpha subunit
MYREAKQRLGDPVLAWADVVNDPDRRRRYHQARGKGGLVRVSWAEAVEMIAAAQVHTIKTYGPDRISAFSRFRRCRWCRTALGRALLSSSAES